MKKLIVGISGASGVIYGIRILEMLKAIDDLINHSVGRVLDLFDIDTGIIKRWSDQKAVSGAIEGGKL